VQLKSFSQRWLLACGSALCAAMMATALYFQHVKGLEPCPLCIIQRVIVIALGVVMLVAAVHNPARVGRRLYGALIVLIAAAGVGVAGRHVWLQSLPPDQVPECGPGLEYLLNTFPLVETLEMVFKGSGECAEVLWTFLGLSIPGWTLVMFTAMTGFGLFFIFSRRGLPAG
jgi:disulfide bond formation protein DsbB